MKKSIAKENQEYWEQRYLKGETGWDAGKISPPLKEYIDQLTDKGIRILIPGCGSAYEAQYLHESGFTHVVVIDVVELVLDRLATRVPGFPSEHIILGNFFRHEGCYDLILEQTFFSSISPELRAAYAAKVSDLLVSKGKLSGVLFDFEIESGPPFGGTVKEYKRYFDHLFDMRTIETCYNSNETWQDLELFIIFEKSDQDR